MLIGLLYSFFVGLAKKKKISCNSWVGSSRIINLLLKIYYWFINSYSYSRSSCIAYIMNAMEASKGRQYYSIIGVHSN